MFGIETVIALVKAHGLALIAPLSILEGPIVTVIAAYLASLAYLNIYAVIVVVILGDLIGDVILYGAGRWGSGARWMARLGLSDEKLGQLTAHFADKGPRTLVFGKWTHSAGAAVLFAAGVARMPFGTFLFWNTLATVPKSLLFVAIGYSFGHLYNQIDDWIGRISAVLLTLLIMGAGLWWWNRRRKRG
ncbi:MAG: DedA family protein [Paracoccaceae bacterium]